MNNDIGSNFSYETIVEYYMDCLLNGKEMANREVDIRDLVEYGPFFEWAYFSYIINCLDNCTEVSDDRISTCILTYNNASTINFCLNSIKRFSEEIIIIDSGSTDNTLNICKHFTDKIINVSQNLSFSEKRNVAIEKCSGDWIFMIDSDEIVPDGFEMNIRKHITWAKTKGIDILWLSRFWIDKADTGKWRQYYGHLSLWPDPQARFFRRNANCYYVGDIHEKLFYGKAKKAALIINQSSCLIHLKYIYNKATLNVSLQQRRAKNSDLDDELQLYPWNYNMPTKNFEIESKYFNDFA